MVSIKKIIKNFLICFVLAGIVLALSFYTIVLSGLFPKIQTMWVTTAMTTMSHKWLATSFIPKVDIDRIMEENKVDDEHFDTNPELVTIKAPNLNNNDVLESVLKKRTELILNKYEMVQASKKQEESTNVFLENNVYGVDIDIDIDEEEITFDYESEGYEKLEDGLYKKEVSGTGWKGYLLLVSDPSRVTLVDSKYQHTRGDTVKNMVKYIDGVAGINAGGFDDGPNYDSNGGIPAGLLIVDGEVVSPKKNNGSTHSVVGFNKENVLVLGKMTQNQALERGIVNSVDFKPFLIVNGEKVIKKGTGGWGIAPRTALGQRETGEVVFFAVDGRQAHSIGVDLVVLQDTLYDEGCINAAMVDGGSSTVMVYNDEFINKPSLGHERYINNAFVIKR